MDGRLRKAIEEGDAEAVERLVREQPELADDTDEGVSAALFALYRRREEIARTLLGARSRPADLFEAAALGLEDRVEHLLGGEPAAGIAALASDGFTALHLAAYFGRVEVVRRLLAAGAEVEAVARNATRVRPLHSAVAGGSDAVVEALLAAGADPEARQAGGYTPLMGAAAGGSEPLVRRLLAAGGDREAVNDNGETAADIARQRGHERIAALLAES
jgi:ankyrin repeat protein